MLELRKQALDLRRVLSGAVIAQHVLAKMGIAREHLVGAFSGQDHLETGIAHGAAQHVLRDEVPVQTEGLGVVDRIGEIVGQRILADRNRHPFGARPARHLLGRDTLVIVFMIEAQREGADRIGPVTRGETQHGAGIDTAAEIATDRHVRTQAHFDGIVEKRRESALM